MDRRFYELRGEYTYAAAEAARCQAERYVAEQEHEVEVALLKARHKAQMTELWTASHDAEAKRDAAWKALVAAIRPESEPIAEPTSAPVELKLKAVEG